MCLGGLVKMPKSKTGWKCFNSWSGNLTSIYYSPYTAGSGPKPMPTGEWLYARDFKPKDVPSQIECEYAAETYPAGFHYYAREKDAYDFAMGTMGVTVRRVKANYIVATGHQDGDPVMVAKQIYIYPEGGE